MRHGPYACSVRQDRVVTRRIAKVAFWNARGLSWDMVTSQACTWAMVGQGGEAGHHCPVNQPQQEVGRVVEQGPPGGWSLQVTSGWPGIRRCPELEGKEENLCWAGQPRIVLGVGDFYPGKPCPPGVPGLEG